MNTESLIGQSIYDSTALALTATTSSDIMSLNVMYDGEKLYPRFHPAIPSRSPRLRSLGYRSRTVRPPKYYLVDFGISRQYSPDDGAPRAYPILGGDTSVPEHQGTKGHEMSDPFPTDIYFLGNLVREEIQQVESFQYVSHIVRNTASQKYIGFEFAEPLIADMVQNDPVKRPKISEVVARWTALRRTLSFRALRKRLIGRGEDEIDQFFKGMVHSARTASYILRSIPPIPRCLLFSPSSSPPYVATSWRCLRLLAYTLSVNMDEPSGKTRPTTLSPPPVSEVEEAPAASPLSMILNTDATFADGQSRILTGGVHDADTVNVTNDVAQTVAFNGGPNSPASSEDTELTRRKERAKRFNIPLTTPATVRAVVDSTVGDARPVFLICHYTSLTYACPEFGQTYAQFWFAK